MKYFQLWTYNFTINEDNKIMLIFLFINLKDAPSWPLNVKGNEGLKPYLLRLLVFVGLIYICLPRKSQNIIIMKMGY
jgi:hypothetical protein